MSTLKAALGMAAKGHRVFPAVRKRPLIEEWQLRATSDPEIIKNWWSTWTDANIAWVPGLSDMAVLDVDPRHGGNESLKEFGPLPDTLTVRTPSGGRHFYFRGAIRSRNAIRPGLDVKSNLGYVICPPSSIDGKNYEYLNAGIPVASLPEILRELLNEPKTASMENLVVGGEPIPEGQRNGTLASLAGSMRRKGMTSKAIEAALKAENLARCRPPLQEAEIQRIATSISRYAPEVPKCPPVYTGADGQMEKPVLLADFEEPGPREKFLGGRLPQGHPAILYGDGGMGKSLLALGACMGVASGQGFLGLPMPKGAVLYADWELSLDEQLRRAYKIARGLSLSRPPSDLLYLNPAMPLPALRRVPELVEKYGLRLLVIDSMNPACGGNPEVAEEIIKIFGAIKGFGVTTLILDHQAKMQQGQDYAKKTPFGSAFKFNLSRSVMHLERVEAEQGAIKLLLTHTKSNFGPLAEALAIRIRFGADSVDFEALDMKTDLAFSERLGADEKILVTLKDHGPATVEELGKLTGIRPKTIRNMLPKLRRAGKAKETDRNGKELTWEASSTCPPAQTYSTGHLGTLPDVALTPEEVSEINQLKAQGVFRD